jgi:hypothetical protein
MQQQDNSNQTQAQDNAHRILFDELARVNRKNSELQQALASAERREDAMIKQIGDHQTLLTQLMDEAGISRHLSEMD